MGWLRLTRPSGGFFAFQGNAKDSSKIAPYIYEYFVGKRVSSKRRPRPIDFSIAFGRSREAEVCW